MKEHYILLSCEWIMEHHEPRQAFWRAGFYVSYQIKQPEAQCHAVFLWRAHSLAAILCHPHVFLVRRDHNQLISRTKFPAQFFGWTLSINERHFKHISPTRYLSRWKEEGRLFQGKTDDQNEIYFCSDDLVYTMFKNNLFTVMHFIGCVLPSICESS